MLNIYFLIFLYKISQTWISVKFDDTSTIFEMLSNFRGDFHKLRTSHTIFYAVFFGSNYCITDFFYNGGISKEDEGVKEVNPGNCKNYAIILFSI